MADLYGLLIEDLFRRRAPRIPRPFNPDHFLWRAGEHGLHGLLHAALGPRSGLAPELEELRPRLKTLTLAQEAVVQVRLRAARELAELWDLRGIPGVFVKGVALAVEAYEGPGDRPFADLDVLVSPAVLPRARAVAEELGYRQYPRAVRSGMEVALLRAGAGGPGVGLDLHWAFTEPKGPQAAVRVPVEEIVGRRRRIGDLPLPTMEDSLLLAAANLARSRMDRMILVADFDRLVRRRLDWNVVVERAHAWRLRTALWLGLSRAMGFLGTEVPERVLADLRPAAWRVASLGRVLTGSYLWMRRKFKRPVASAALAFLCLDSVPDEIRGLARSGDRLLRWWTRD
jgi:hypothetical protein